MRVLATIFLIVSMSACCTKADCPCEMVVVTIRMTPPPADDYKLVITDLQYKPEDSINAIFHGEEFEMFERMMGEEWQVEDHNYFLKNLKTGSIDTISEITNVRSDSTFECNDCLLKKDIYHCESLRSKQLKHNGEIINGYTVVINN